MHLIYTFYSLDMHLIYTWFTLDMHLMCTLCAIDMQYNEIETEFENILVDEYSFEMRAIV